MNGLEIREIRRDMHKTQAEFAEIIGVSKNSVQLWETGKRNPSKRTLLLIKKTHKEHKNKQESNGKTHINNTSPEKNDNESDQNIEKIVDLIFENLSEFESNERFSKYILLKNKDAIIKYQEELLAKANVTNSSDKK